MGKQSFRNRPVLRLSAKPPTHAGGCFSPTAEKTAETRRMCPGFRPGRPLLCPFRPSGILAEAPCRGPNFPGDMENGKTGRSSSGLSVSISLNKSGDRDFGRLSSGLSVPSLFHALNITFAEHLHSFIFVQILQIPVRHLAVSHLHDIDINGLFPPLFVNVFHGFKI